MEECLRRVRGYNEDNVQMKAIVQSMDVQLCNKANKLTVVDLENRMEEDHKYLHEQLPACKTQIASIKQATGDECTGLRSKIEGFASYIIQNLSGIVDEVVTQKLRLYDRVSRDFQQFFSQGNLKEQLDGKVDLKEFRAACEGKASRQELFKYEIML